MLVHKEDGAASTRGRAPHAEGLTRQASFAKEVAGAQHRHDRLSPRLRENANLLATLLDVQNALTGIALSEDDISSPILHDPSRDSRRVEERLGIERPISPRFHGRPLWHIWLGGLLRRRLRWTVATGGDTNARGLSSRILQALTTPRDPAASVQNWTAVRVACSLTRMSFNAGSSEERRLLHHRGTS